MGQKQLDRLTILERVKDRRLTQSEAARLLGISDRQVRRLYSAYSDQGAQALVSKHYGRTSNRAYPEALRKRVLKLVKSQYHDFGPTLICEKLQEAHGIQVSRETIRKWLIADGHWLTRKERKKKVHQPRYRRERYGELIQIDGSDHHWFEDRGLRCTLLVYIDDATGRLMELRFCESETTFDYFLSTRRYLEKHGKPVAFYSDKHSVFRVNKQGATTGNNMTQFSRALNDLNIDIICANTSQAKGRVERANKTLQDRLVKELRLRGIDGIDQANQFLPEFLEAFNKRFGKEPYNLINMHRPLLEHEDMEDVFTWQEPRTVSNSLTIQYDRVTYLIEPNDQTVELKRKKVTVYDYPDGTVDIRYEGQSLPFSIFDKVRQVDQGAIVSNKRLGAVLSFIKEEQKEKGLKRSKKAPSRRAQQQSQRERPSNPAVTQAK
ncbi:ISNCY family transposase [Pseudomaricurvus alkylphenolicus]|uniref:ISNCY family transposase n=1 Tax=Pseudomaricurvus alkylphenolicus TaxID=1306991 RepID=UPI001420F8FE|nr:ISNCY family transposase [Pseudomaricurvus alkylphenolicus]NIB45245.1 ISNCY family transposase [Pseudomaricurvus alkylphenolicus]